MRIGMYVCMYFAVWSCVRMCALLLTVNVYGICVWRLYMNTVHLTDRPRTRGWGKECWGVCCGGDYSDVIATHPHTIFWNPFHPDSGNGRYGYGKLH